MHHAGLCHDSHEVYCAIMLMHVVHLHEDGKVYNYYVKKMRIKIYNSKLNVVFRAIYN